MSRDTDLETCPTCGALGCVGYCDGDGLYPEAVDQSGPLMCDCCTWTGPAGAFLVEQPDDSDPEFTTVRCLDEGACRGRLIEQMGRDLDQLERDRVAAEGEVEPLPW